MQVAIYGLYKTGTTLLFHIVRQALASDCREIFEQSAFQPLPESERTDVVAKVILGEPVNSPDLDYLSFAHFDRHILTIRDPRDWLVSGLLFLVQQQENIYSNESNRQYILDLFRRKEREPESLSVRYLLEQILDRAGQGDLDEVMTWMDRQYRFLLRFEEQADAFLQVKYEDFASGKLEAVSHYLGLSCSGEVAIPPEHDHVPRTRSSGNWRDWLLEEDTDFFKTVFQPYILRHHYAGHWETNSTRFIDPRHCSEYLERVSQRAQARTAATG